MIDRHMRFVLYTPQVEEAKAFFRYLKSILQLPEVANQEVVLIEQTAIWLMDSSPPPSQP